MVLQVIVFTGGGTGGHVYPGVAVLQALRQRWAEHPFRAVWIGSETGIERRIAEGMGLEYHAIATGKLRRYWDIKNLTDLFRIVKGYFQAKALLKKLRPQFVFSKGGFVSVPPVRAARALKIPVFSHESDLDPGLATRLNLQASLKVFCAYSESLHHFPVSSQARLVVTGNPVRSELLKGDSTWVRQTWKIPPAAKVLLVVGGSLGALQVNELVRRSLPLLEGKVFVIHQTGEGWTPPADGPWYASRPFFPTEMPHLYAGADIVFGRSGAGTLWEAAATLRPLILLPLGAGSRGDQVRNAELFRARGAAQVLPVEPTAEHLCQALSKYLDNSTAYHKVQDALAQFDAQGAAQRIVSAIVDAIQDPKGV